MQNQRARRHRRKAEHAIDVALETELVLRAPDDGPLVNLPGDHSRLAAHEIRSHLAVLNGYLTMMEEGSLGQAPPAMARVVPELRAKARAIGQLVDDMLEDARLEDGRLHLARRIVDLRAVVAEAAADAEIGLGPSHRLVHKVPPDAVPVSADPGRMAIILRNLLDNAIKYSPNGGLVECLLEVEGAHAIVRVTDEGIGVAPEDAQSIFSRYVRGQGKEGDSIEGVGLGLYICRTLAEMHGGGISYSSRASGGSVFRLRLPLAGG